MNLKQRSKQRQKYGRDIVQCGKPVTEEDLKDPVFRDDNSMTGLCPECQDDLTAILCDEE